VVEIRRKIIAKKLKAADRPPYDDRAALY